MFPWLNLLLVLGFGLGLVGLFYSIRGLIRLSNPTENFFQFPATQLAFRFRVTRPGAYDVVRTRSGRWGNGFDVPRLTLRLRPLPAGPEQLIQTSNWNFWRQNDFSGKTTVRIGGFEALAAGEYELLNPDGGQFAAGDQLRIQSPVVFQSVLCILAIIGAAFLALGGLLGGLARLVR